MKITGIKIQEKYNLKHVDISFSKEENALVVGPNGWGKSNIVRSVTTAIEKVEVQQYFKADQREPAVKSLVKLSFVLNKDELWTILMWRLIFVTERMFILCHALAQKNIQITRHVAPEQTPEVIEFWNDVFPKLMSVLAKCYESLDGFIASKMEADVVVTHRADRASWANFMGIQLPDRSTDEFDIIASFLKEKFGDDILGEKEEFLGMPVNKNGAQEGELPKSVDIENHVKNILNHEVFLILAGFESQESYSGRRQSIYQSSLSLGFSRFREWIQDYDLGHSGEQEKMEMILKTLKKINCTYSNEKLGFVIKPFIKERSVCVVSQDRGNGRQEEGALFWSMKKAEDEIMSAHLSGKDNIKYKMLQKVQEAILVIANVELDVVKQGNAPSNVLFRNSVDSDWRKLDEASGGERELILVLTAIHLSGANSVFLDEPGHSLHPPKQAQLRRWLESKKDDNQALFLITHATDMVSSHWLDGLYHMYSDDGRYSAASLNEFVPHTDENAQPPEKKRRLFDKNNKIDLDPKLGDFLMGVEMRRLFFSSGTVFVEGDSDKRVIEALRLVELDRLSLKMKNPDDVSYNDRLSAYWDTQMDQWDIICMDGSANWLKAYQAASNLKVPFVIVLDADVLNKISGSSIAPITYEDWVQSRLRKAAKKELDAIHPLAKMVENVDKILEDKAERSRESSVREELKKHDLWVWQQRDLESALFDEEDVRNALFANPFFKEELEQIGMSFQDDTSKSGRTKSWKIEQMKAIGERFEALFGEFKDEFEQVTKQIEEDACDDAALLKLDESIMKKAGKVKQDLKNFQKAQSTKNNQKAEQVSIEDGKQDDVDKWAFFFNLKKKLHAQGCWKLISSKALQGWLAEALKIKEDHPFHLLWEHIRTRRIRERGNTEVPPHVMKRLLPN